MSEKTIVAGSGKVSVATRSNGAPASTSSSNWATVARMVSVIAGHAPRRERARRVAAHARVLGRVEADHRRRRAVAAVEQDLPASSVSATSGSCAAAAENVSWSRKIASMSS